MTKILARFLEVVIKVANVKGEDLENVFISNLIRDGIFLYYLHYYTDARIICMKDESVGNFLD